MDYSAVTFDELFLTKISGVSLLTLEHKKVIETRFFPSDILHTFPHIYILRIYSFSNIVQEVYAHFCPDVLNGSR
jgi:hypothetical protein